MCAPILCYSVLTGGCNQCIATQATPFSSFRMFAESDCGGLPLPTGDFFFAGAALAEAPWLFSVRVWRRCAGYGMIANMVYRMGGGGTPGGWSLPVAMASARANPLQAGMAALMLCNLF